MGTKLLDNKILYAVLSVFLAMILWGYVNVAEGELREETIHNIPVSFIGTDVLQENGLMITGEQPTVDMTISASMITWAKLGADTINLTVDVSRITEPGMHTLAYDTAYSGGVSSSMLSVMDRNPANVTFTVSRYASVEVPVVGTLQEGSSIADGYVFRGFTAEPATIVVSGEADVVSQIDKALVTYSGQDLMETYTGSMSYQLIGVDNQPLEGLDVICTPESVTGTFEILKEAEVPLRVNLEPGGGADETNVTWKIDPDSVIVVGKPEELESLKELTVTVNLAEIEGVERQTITRTIPLAEGLEILGGIQTANVELNFHGLTIKTLEVNPIEQFAIISSTIPQGYRAEIRTKTIAVTLRGTPSALELASASNIRGSIDLSDIDLASGQYTVPVNIQFDGIGGAGVQGVDYEVVVRLTKE